jgi:RNA-dependent RNA polymerase
MCAVAPQKDRSNRILRQYSDYQEHFLRVAFREEGGHGQRLRHQHRAPTCFKTFIERIVGSALKNGFSIAGRKFEWLGYSSSALKAHQMLFMTPFRMEVDEGNGRKSVKVVNADCIRRDMGFFDEKLMKQPAKFGARIALVWPYLVSSLATHANRSHLM